MTEIQILLISLALGRLISELSFHFLNAEQFKKYLHKRPPITQKVMSDQEWQRMTEYSVSKNRFSVFENLLEFVFFLLILLFLYPLFFEKFDLGLEQDSLICSLYAVLFLLALQSYSLFLDYWRQFKIEEEFGFNKSSIKLWIVDKIKGVVLSIILGVGLFWVLLSSYRYLSTISEFWWLFAFGILFSTQILLMVLYPKLIMPLFNKLSPLKDGSLKDRLSELSSKAGFFSKEIKVIDGSKRSSHSNAFFTGFGKFRKIVIFDTLIQQLDEEEIEAVLAHEIGHYKKGHIPKRLFISIFMGIGFFFCFSLIINSAEIYEALKLPEKAFQAFTPAALGFIIFSPYFLYWISPLSNYFSRKHEYEADEFAVRIIGGNCKLSNALLKMYKKNLSHPLPHPWFSFFHHSHPNLFERDKNISRVISSL